MLAASGRLGPEGVYEYQKIRREESPNGMTTVSGAAMERVLFDEMHPVMVSAAEF